MRLRLPPSLPDSGMLLTGVSCLASLLCYPLLTLTTAQPTTLPSSALSCPAAVAGDALSNRGEAHLVVRLLQGATAAGVPGDQIGVISPYRAQVALLGRLAKEAAGRDEVEVLTVDKCQGRDKDCILLSLVRSNPEAEAGEWGRAASRPGRCWRYYLDCQVFAPVLSLHSVPTTQLNRHCPASACCHTSCPLTPHTKHMHPAHFVPPPAGKLLADWRRINVAITRSRKKLVLLGDAATLRSIQLFARLVALVQERGWFLQLPGDALQP